MMSGVMPSQVNGMSCSIVQGEMSEAAPPPGGGVRACLRGLLFNSIW